MKLFNTSSVRNNTILTREPFWDAFLRHMWARYQESVFIYVLSTAPAELDKHTCASWSCYSPYNSFIWLINLPDLEWALRAYYLAIKTDWECCLCTPNPSGLSLLRWCWRTVILRTKHPCWLYNLHDCLFVIDKQRWSHPQSCVWFRAGGSGSESLEMEKGVLITPLLWSDHFLVSFDLILPVSPSTMGPPLRSMVQLEVPQPNESPNAWFLSTMNCAFSIVKPIL